MNTERRTLKRGVTVDGPLSRDLDDAIYWERRGDGWYVEVSISDVGAQTALLTEFDAEAYSQGYTVYMRESNRPMWPRYFSENQLSLLPNQPRLTLTKKILLDRELKVITFEIEPTILISQARMTYEQVDTILNDPKDQLYQSWTDGVELALRLLNQRREKGALALFDLHKGYMTTEEGEVITIPQGRYYRAYILVQELMILANRVTTDTLKNAGWYFLFRNHHADPELTREYLTNAVSELDHEVTPELIERLINVTNSLLGRAKYSPYCESHFGLNLEAYAHWTSPIRRYVDVVNQRILHAWLLGEKNPYSLKELELIAQHLNQRANEIRDHGNDFFRQQRTKILASCGSDQIVGLEPGFFSALIKRLVDGTFELTPERSDGIIRRILADDVRMANIGCILLYFEGVSERWSAVKKTAFEWIVNRPENGYQIWAAARSILDLPQYTSVKFQRRSSGGQFRCQASIVIYDLQFTGQPIEASQKKQAERLAFLALLAEIASVSLDMQEEVVPVEIGTENPKGRLYELCQKNGWAFPEYIIVQSGAAHAPTFTGTATLVIGEETYASAELSASQRKEVERLTSQSLLDTIPPDYLEDNSGPSIETSALRNPIGALQEWCQRHGHPVPTYEFDQTGADHAPVFKATCTVVIGGEPHRWAGIYNAKKEAKKLAASEACLALLPST